MVVEKSISDSVIYARSKKVKYKKMKDFGGVFNKGALVNLRKIKKRSQFNAWKFPLVCKKSVSVPVPLKSAEFSVMAFLL